MSHQNPTVKPLLTPTTTFINARIATEIFGDNEIAQPKAAIQTAASTKTQPGVNAQG